MAFSEFTDFSQTLRQLGLRYKRADLFAGAPPLEPSKWLQESLTWHYGKLKQPFSEMYAREFLISPLLGYMARRSEPLNLYSNEFPLEGPPALNGFPDYLIAYPSAPGILDADAQYPLLAIAVVKRENFNAGWAQCAAELYVCRFLNQKAGGAKVPLWGIVTNGLHWEFGRLENDVLTLQNGSLDYDPLSKLLGALAFVFAECLETGAARLSESGFTGLKDLPDS